MNGPISIAVTTTRKPGGRANGSSGPTVTACDQCYRCKVRCSGEKPTCERCRTQSSACTYSTGKPLGKPKGSRNKVQRTTSLDITRANKLANAPHKAKDDLALKSPSPKRKSEEELKPSKRMSFSSPSNDRPHPVSVQSVVPPIVVPDVPSLPPPHALKDGASQLLEPIAFTISSTNNLDSVFDPSISPNISGGFPPETASGFPSEDMHFDIDDFHWITQADSYVTGSPAQTYDHLTSMHFTTLNSSIAEFIPAPTPAPAISVHIPDPAPTYRPLTPSPTAASHLTSPGQQQPCVCDPLALRIIAELYTIQRSLKSSQLDHALLLAHRGLTTVSSYLSCPSCQASESSSPRSPSLLLACVLILQQVFSCYGTLRSQGHKLLENGRKAGVSIGDFEVEEEESCNGILEAIVKAEMERGKGVIGGLERWAQDVEIGALATEKPAGALLRALRDEIGAA